MKAITIKTALFLALMLALLADVYTIYSIYLTYHIPVTSITTYILRSDSLLFNLLKLSLLIIITMMLVEVMHKEVSMIINKRRLKLNAKVKKTINDIREFAKEDDSKHYVADNIVFDKKEDTKWSDDNAVVFLGTKSDHLESKVKSFMEQVSK